MMLRMCFRLLDNKDSPKLPLSSSFLLASLPIGPLVSTVSRPHDSSLVSTLMGTAHRRGSPALLQRVYLEITRKLAWSSGSMDHFSRIQGCLQLRTYWTWTPSLVLGLQTPWRSHERLRVVCLYRGSIKSRSFPS